jgi:hypothetical protein
MVSSSKTMTQEEKPRLEQAYGCEGSVLEFVQTTNVQVVGYVAELVNVAASSLFQGCPRYIPSMNSGIIESG